MGKVLVKGIGAQYPASGGPPIMVASGGGNEKARGKTFREKLGGMAGGVLGALGSLAGQHRSLGGLAQSAISGGVQGKQLGQGLGRSTVTREGQARANIREDNRQKVAVRNAKLAEQARSRGQGPMSRFNPIDWVRRKNTAVKDAADANLVAVNRRNRNPVITPYKPPEKATIPLPDVPKPPVPLPNTVAVEPLKTAPSAGVEIEDAETPATYGIGPHNNSTTEGEVSDNNPKQFDEYFEDPDPSKNLPQPSEEQKRAIETY
tara:strand:+ start:6182 stop:6967 length:786 start_codon:yes stop_codon:yes gene_type:complete